MLRLFVLLSVLLGAAQFQSIPAGCTNNIPCGNVSVGDLTFQCRFSGPVDGVPVILLHGFPEWSYFWLPQLQYWSDNETPYRAVACDLRGYSPEATPTDINDYEYSHFIQDVWGIADAVGFEKFHLIGHDHGASLGWITTARSDGRVISYTAMSVPHPDVFSDALYGDNTVPEQIYASNYFNQFAEGNSSAEGLYKLFRLTPGFRKQFPTSESFQPPLWWYNGSMATYVARPPVVLSTTDDFLFFVQRAVPIPARPGLPQTIPTGNVDVPVLFVCGEYDPYLLCTLPYVENTYKLVPEYHTLNVQCGHDVMNCDMNKVDPESQALLVHKRVTEFIRIEAKSHN